MWTREYLICQLNEEKGTRRLEEKGTRRLAIISHK